MGGTNARPASTPTSAQEAAAPPSDAGIADAAEADSARADADAAPPADESPTVNVRSNDGGRALTESPRTIMSLIRAQVAAIGPQQDPWSMGQIPTRDPRLAAVEEQVGLRLGAKNLSLIETDLDGAGPKEVVVFVANPASVALVFQPTNDASLPWRFLGSIGADSTRSHPSFVAGSVLGSGTSKWLALPHEAGYGLAYSRWTTSLFGMRDGKLHHSGDVPTSHFERFTFNDPDAALYFSLGGKITRVAQTGTDDGLDVTWTMNVSYTDSTGSSFDTLWTRVVQGHYSKAHSADVFQLDASQSTLTDDEFRTIVTPSGVSLEEESVLAFFANVAVAHAQGPEARSKTWLRAHIGGFASTSLATPLRRALGMKP
jgi:hypothetical protein